MTLKLSFIGLICLVPSPIVGVFGLQEHYVKFEFGASFTEYVSNVKCEL